MLAALAVIFGAPADALRAVSELERELYRELHHGCRRRAAACRAARRRLACYERLAKIAHFAPLPIQAEPAQCATDDLVRLERVLMPDQTLVALNPPPTLLLQHGGSGGGVDPRRRRPRRRRARRAARRRSPSSIPTSAAAATTSPGAKLSEHGKGNALDISAIKLRNGAHVQPDRSAGLQAVSRADARPRPAPGSPRCWGRAPTAITRTTSISISPSARTAIGSASGMSSSRRRRRRGAAAAARPMNLTSDKPSASARRK